MPVTRRGSTYQATVHHGGKRWRQSFKTASEAEVWLAEAKVSILKGEQPPSAKGGQKMAPKTLRELYTSTYKKFWADSKSPGTSSSNAQACIDVLGEHTAPSAVDIHAIDALIEVFEGENISNSTINRRLSALSRMLTHAGEQGWIGRVPKIPKKKEPINRIRYLTVDEEDELLAYFKFIARPEMVDIITLAVDTGMRRGELMKLQSNHFDLMERLIKLPGEICKSGKPRDIPMTTRVYEILKARRGVAGAKIIEGITSDILRHQWDRGRHHLGLLDDKQFVFHALRHTFCSRLVQRGIPIQVVSELAGHGNIHMTMRYAHLCPKNLRSAISVLDK